MTSLMIAFVPKSRFLPMDSKPNYKTARVLAILEIDGLYHGNLWKMSIFAFEKYWKNTFFIAKKYWKNTK